MHEAFFFERRPERMPLGKLLPWVGTAVSRRFHQLVAAHGMTPTALSVLGVLAHRDGVSHRELAGHLGRTPATLTPVVDALEAAGEVRRDRDGTDRRVVRLSITPAGRERLTATFAQVATSFRERMPHPPPEHEAIIRAYLTAVLTAVSDEGGEVGDE
jgi:DNA-binding MarR family transcriptional regulator